jgi:hypothetical protein
MRLAEHLAKDPLYDVLKKIGAKQKSLDWLGLMEYDLLLQLPAIERRVDKDASPDERARAASHAIHDAVKTIVQPCNAKRVAQAVFCTTKPFIGESVGGRKAILAREGIDHKKFRTLRPYVMGCVMEYLRADAETKMTRQDETRTKPITFSADIYRHQTIVSLKQAALLLQYTALATLFVMNVESNLDSFFAPPIQTSHLTPPPSYLFDAAAIFRDRASAAIIDHPVAFRRFMMKAQHWPATRADWLIDVSTELSTLDLRDGPRADQQLARLPFWPLDIAGPSVIEKTAAKAGAIGEVLGSFRWEIESEDERIASTAGMAVIDSYYRYPKRLYREYHKFIIARASELAMSIEMPDN